MKIFKMNKKSIVISSLCLLLLLIAVSQYAENKDGGTVDLTQKIPETIQFTDTELNEVLTYLNKTTGSNISCDSSIMNMKVSVNIIKGDALNQVLEYLKTAYGLNYLMQEDGSIILEYHPVVELKEEEFGAVMDKMITAPKVKKEALRMNYSFYNSPGMDFNTEEYDRIYENIFFNVLDNPLSTFSIDVDTASYANMRRYINQQQLPPEDAVRIEEMINYFTYNYREPIGDDPFELTSEVAECPWNTQNKLVMVGLQGEKIKTENMPPNNLVFLIDVSGSMQDYNKLPLLKKAFKLMVKQLREEDRVSMVVYAGRSAVILDSTPGNQKDKIISSLEELEAGGSTAGSEGIQTAYQIAKENYLPEGNNRVILATDGDFNVGVSSTGELVRMIEEKRDEGIYLTVLGFGTGNYKGSRMEELSNKGNGNYAYIDNLLEAKKVLIDELGGTLLTIAKDVKIQIEFNPAKVKEYRLVGYENRVMENKDFSDDTKDAGELGAGHTVTAFYEIIPVDSEDVDKSSDLKYQDNVIKDESYNTNEIMTVKLRYKEPDETVSKLITTTVIDQNLTVEDASENFKFASAVAEFGMLLRDSEFKANSSYDDLLSRAREAKGEDKFGYRAEFIRLVQMVELIYLDM